MGNKADAVYEISKNVSGNMCGLPSELTELYNSCEQDGTTALLREPCWGPQQLLSVVIYLSLTDTATVLLQFSIREPHSRMRGATNTTLTHIQENGVHISMYD
jgi:hypothetical protein